jgi:acyl-CoA synthetase (AMP-forming)/AMP-acid ligase II
MGVGVLSRESQATQANASAYLLEPGGPGAVAVIDRSGAYTYSDLRAQTASLVASIEAWSLPKGSRIGILAPNSLFWVASYLAVMHAGHVAVPFATTLTPEDVRSRAEFVGCVAHLVDRTLAVRFAEVFDAVALVADQSLVDVGAPDPLPPSAPVDPDDDAVLVFTSGTTARPRAVRVSHRNILANTESIIGYLGLDHDDRMLVVLPFSYCFGASLLHTHLRAGASISLCETFAFPETVVEAIERDHCTGLAGVPSTYQRLLKASTFASRELPSLRHLQQAGGRLPQVSLDAVAAAQPQARLFVMYGQTEATARLSYLPPEDRDAKPTSVGRGLDTVTLRVADDAGRTLPAGHVGEIRARGPNIAKGYWNDPEGTSAKFQDGELRTGDLGTSDDEGFVYIVDRKEDFIKSWGVRVSPHEIEDAVTGLQDVVAAAAVGRPDDQAGEAIVLFYTARDGAELAPAEVLLFSRRVLSRSLVPVEAHRIEKMPLNGNGKILRAALRERAAVLHAGRDQAIHREN